ncbi:MAG: TonB-dependent receptor [Betaproteobacteria bacterium]|nr:MAG: TonB-dependent receptor [Betaproteobacteria bacterium]
MVLNNVFDRKYYTYAVRSQFTADKYAVYPLPGRTLSLTAEVALR